MKKNPANPLLHVVFLLLVSMSVHAQSEISFTNKVSFSKTGNMGGTKLTTFIPAPVTNEYQEITELQSNCGYFTDGNSTNKILLYDGPFDGEALDVYESFLYKTKKVKIDFNNKSNQNIVAGCNPQDYLGTGGDYINTKNKTIKQIGDQLWNESSDMLDYAKRCYEYVASHYQYIAGSWRTLAEIIQQGGGECGDFTTLFVNLMRYKGIPARHNIGVWVNGGYHVWPDFYHEDYGWIPVDPTFKNSNPSGDYFGRYDGNLIILSQDMTTFSGAGFSMKNEPLQTFYFWFSYDTGSGDVQGTHKTSKDYQVTHIQEVKTTAGEASPTFSLLGIPWNKSLRGIYIAKGKRVFMK